MILVLADDLSGAAEIAGEAFGAGFTAEVRLDAGGRVEPPSTAQVVVVDTESRSLGPSEAAAAVRRAYRLNIHGTEVALFKKVDSLLRGNVLAETVALMRVTGRRLALLAPANPARGRLIREGRYEIEGIPLQETVFARDPEHPRTTSDVIDLLGSWEGDRPLLIGHRDALPEMGLVVADVLDPVDLERRATEVDADTLAAGAAEFFRAWLRCQFPEPRRPHGALSRDSESRERPMGPTLFVCGSAAAWRQGRAEEAGRYSVPIVTLPPAPAAGVATGEGASEWVRPAVDALAAGTSVLVAIGRSESVEDVPPEELVRGLVDGVALVLERVTPGHIAVEGGATAMKLVRRLGWGRFEVSRRVAGGVVGLAPMDSRSVEVVVKVGSYAWPESVWREAAR